MQIARRACRYPETKMAVSKSSSSSVSRSPRPAATTAKKSSSSNSRTTSSRGATRTSNPSKSHSTHRSASTTAAQSKPKTSEVKPTGRAGDQFQASAELQEERAGTARAAEAGNHNALVSGLVSNYAEPTPAASAPGQGSGSVQAVNGNGTAPAATPAASGNGTQAATTGDGKGNGTTTTPTGQPLSGEGQKRADEAVQVQNKVESEATRGTEQGTPSSDTVKALREQAGDPPKLDNVLTVHGLFADESTFKTMNDYWTSTGVNKQGGTIKGKDLAGLSMDDIKNTKNPAELAKRLGLNPEGNIYNMQFSGNSNASNQNREELAKAVQVVSQLRGGGQVDLVAHSKGGIDSRNLLASGQGDKVRSLTMLGTPNKGSGVADIAQTSVGSYGAGYLEGNRATPGRPALGELASGSQFTQQLNQGLPEQLSQLKGGALAIQGATPLGGDGVVSYDSANVPGAINKTSWGSMHMDMGTGLGITNSPAVIKEVSSFLSGRPLSQGQDLFDGMGGRALSAVSNGYDATKQFVGDAATAVGNTAAAGWEGAKYYGNQAYEGTVNGVNRGYEGTKYYANQGWEGAKHYGNQAYEGTVNGATRAYDATTTGLKNAYEGVTTAASDAWNYLFK